MPSLSFPMLSYWSVRKKTEDKYSKTIVNLHDLNQTQEAGKAHAVLALLFSFFSTFPWSEAASRLAPYVLTVSCWESPGHISSCPAQLLQQSCLHVVCLSNSEPPGWMLLSPLATCTLAQSLAAAHLWAPASHPWLWRMLDKSRKKSRTEKMQNHHSVQGWGKNLS